MQRQNMSIMRKISMLFSAHSIKYHVRVFSTGQKNSLKHVDDKKNRRFNQSFTTTNIQLKDVIQEAKKTKNLERIIRPGTK